MMLFILGGCSKQLRTRSIDYTNTDGQTWSTSCMWYSNPYIQVYKEGQSQLVCGWSVVALNVTSINYSWVFEKR
jgi:hypothetical protein